MNQSDHKRNQSMLRGPLSRRGYLSWWHSFQGREPLTGDMRTFFVEYFVINPALGAGEPILGQLSSNRKKGLKPAYVCVHAGVLPGTDEGLSLRSYYPIDEMKSLETPFYFQVGDCSCSENHLSGYVDISEEEAQYKAFMTDAGSMEWNLEIHKAVAFHIGSIANPLFQFLGALDTFWHGEGIRTFYRGTVTLNGTVYEVSPEFSYGYADRHWGKKPNLPRFQFAGCRIHSERLGRELKHSAIALDGCCPRFLHIPLPNRIFLQITYMGEDFEFNFARPSLFTRMKWSSRKTNKRFLWHIKAQNRSAVAKLSLNCRREGMLPIRYENPDGHLPRTPLFVGGCGIGTIELYRRNGKDLELLDKLFVEDALCMRQAVPKQ